MITAAKKLLRQQAEDGESGVGIVEAFARREEPMLGTTVVEIKIHQAGLGVIGVARIGNWRLD